MLGTFILAFGWFGFNPGSTLAGTDLRIAVVAVNTMLASATGALGATLWMWWFRTKKPDPSMMCNGMLAGLVAITCPCAFVSAGGACCLGLDRRHPGGRIRVLLRQDWQIDDPVGAISVHGVNGAWGCLSLGLFADGTYGDGWNGVPGQGHRPVLRRRHGPVLGRVDRRHRLLRHAGGPHLHRIQGHRHDRRRPSAIAGRRNWRLGHPRNGLLGLQRRW